MAAFSSHPRSGPIATTAARPDADLAGRLVGADELRSGGRHWLWGANTRIDSENFGVNDCAAERRRRLDDQRQHPLARNAPRQVFRNYYVALDTQTDDVAPGEVSGRVRSVQRHVLNWTSE